MSDVITAAEAAEGQVYKTAESELSYFAKFVSREGEKTKLSVFIPKSGKWKEMEVPAAYKLRGLNEAETAEFNAVSAPKVKKVKAPRDPNAPKGEAIKKETGAISGLGMVAAWAKHIGDNVDQIGGRSLVISAMLADFPHKAESINKWIDAYLTYFNTGRFSKYGVERQATSKVWQLSDAEKAAGVKTRASKTLAPKSPEPVAA